MSITPAIVDEHEQRELLDAAIPSFLKQLESAAYAKKTCRDKRAVLRSFADWLRLVPITVHEVNESYVAAFLKRTPRPLPGRMKFERAALRGLLKYLRRIGMIGSPTPLAAPPGDYLIRQYVEYLRHDRGLAESSVLVYVPFIQDWLRDHIARTGGVCMDRFNAVTIQSFLLDHTRKRSSEYVRRLATALRSFFRFLFLRGHRSTDLSRAVPTVCKHRNATVPAFLSEEQVDRVLAATDRSTPVGRRDYAILLLLARLGLRAGEIAALELDDIRWRTGELVIRGKGRMVEHLPLLADVGNALARYLREDRRANASRRVFLRTWAPHVGLTGPAAVGHVVRRRLAGAKIQRSGRGAAHLFRHGLATHMIRHGASLAEIAEVLRHRSQTTTAIYTHVSFEALRAVARPWPPAGGDR